MRNHKINNINNTDKQIKNHYLILTYIWKFVENSTFILSFYFFPGTICRTIANTYSGRNVITNVLCQTKAIFIISVIYFAHFFIIISPFIFPFRNSLTIEIIYKLFLIYYLSQFLDHCTFPSISRKVLNLKILKLYKTTRSSILLSTKITLKDRKISFDIPKCTSYWEIHMTRKDIKRILKCENGKKLLISKIRGDISTIFDRYGKSNSLFYCHTPLGIDKMLRRILPNENYQIILKSSSRTPEEKSIKIQGHPSPWFVFLIKSNESNTFKVV